MKIQGSIVKEQGVTFAIIIVKPHAMSSSSESDKTRATFQALFPGLPLILASQDLRGVFRYQGRHDIVDRLAVLTDPLSQIPWMDYTVS